MVNGNIYFELIEDEIDIQSIDELDIYFISDKRDYKNYIDANSELITRKYNELLKAIKQLDKKIKE